MQSTGPVLLKLEGGLGNQLFELAAGYYLAAKLKVDLYIDQYSIPLTTVHGETENGFEPFQSLLLPNSKKIQLLPTLPNKLTLSLGRRSMFVKRLLLKKRMYTCNPFGLKLFLESNDTKLADEIFEINEPMKLHGNFQSWNIVESAAQYGFPRIIRLKIVPIWITELEMAINFKESLVLHFRVGDDTRANSNFSQPKIEYYLEALKVIGSVKKFDSTFILSDDISRVKEMFGDVFTEDFQYLEMPNDSSPAERLYTLSLFGGIICANSTFCGWAAWSIYNSGGQVVVPVPYSDGPVLGSRDFPPSWHKLDKVTGGIVA